MGAETLWDLPNARRTDPHTSREAARGHRNRGTKQAHRERVWTALVARPGGTAGEYGERTGLGHVEAQRRLSDLERAGYAEKGAARTCETKGSRMKTWWPREREE